MVKTWPSESTTNARVLPWVTELGTSDSGETWNPIYMLSGNGRPISAEATCDSNVLD